VLSESCFRPVADDLRDVDSLIFQSPLVAVGAFRCPTAHPRFSDSGLIRNHCFVFPRTASVIEHDSGDRFVGDQTRISLYNPGQAYRRTAISPEGDHSDYFSVAPQILREALQARHALTAEADDSRLFHRSHGVSPASLYLRQRGLFRAVRSAQVDVLEVESGVIALLDDVLTGGEVACGPWTGSHRRLAQDAQALLAERFAESLSLHDVAADLGTSAYHLCRIFRTHTGETLHRHRDQLRLRAALNRLETAEDLTTIGLDVGYSSHSHFTAAFRRAFGVVPSHLRYTL
jgi:AraC family transcriptional regulator